MKKLTRLVAFALCIALSGVTLAACVGTTKYKVTIEPVEAAQGTVVVKIGNDTVTSGTSYKKDSNLAITVTPAAGYQVESLKINNDAKTLAGNGAAKTATHKLVADVTIKVTFATEITGVSVVDGADGYTPVTAPLVGQVLRANVLLANGTTIGTYPATTGASYEWYYEENNQVIGTSSSYTVTSDNLGKTISAKVTFTNVVGVKNGSAIWTAEKTVESFTVAVVDGADGYTPVTTPIIGQVLRANVVLPNGDVIGTYPATAGVGYEWYYVENDQVIGTDSSYTVTSDNVGKTIAVKVTFTDVEDVDDGYATWVAGQQVGNLAITSIAVVDGGDGYTPATTPIIGQVLRANVTLSNGTVIGTYPATTGVEYEWYYAENDQVIGTDSSYTVTSDNVGKTIAAKVTFTDVNGVEDGVITWTAEQVVAGYNTTAQAFSNLTGLSPIEYTDGGTGVQDTLGGYTHETLASRADLIAEYGLVEVAFGFDLDEVNAALTGNAILVFKVAKPNTSDAYMLTFDGENFWNVLGCKDMAAFEYDGRYTEISNKAEALKTFFEQNTDYTGYLGPVDGFGELPQNQFNLAFGADTAGDYTVTMEIVDLGTGEVLASVSNLIRVA